MKPVAAASILGAEKGARKDAMIRHLANECRPPIASEGMP